MSTITPIRRTPNQSPRIPLDIEAEILNEALERFSETDADPEKAEIAGQLRALLDLATVVIFPYGDTDYLISGYEDLNASAMRAIREAVA